MKNIDADREHEDVKCICRINQNSLKIIAFGNALLDISVRISNDEILQRHKFGPNEQGELSQDILDNVIQDVRNK